MTTTPSRHVHVAPGSARRSADSIGRRHRARRAPRAPRTRRRRRGDRRRGLAGRPRPDPRRHAPRHPHSTTASSDVVVDWSRIVFEAAMTDDGYISFLGVAAPGDGAHRDARRAQRHQAPLRAVRLRRPFVRCGPGRGCRGSGARRARGRLSRPAGDAGRRARDLARHRARRPCRDQGPDARRRGGGGDRRPPRGRRHGRRPLQLDVRAGDRAGRLPVRAAVPLHLRGGLPLRDAVRAHVTCSVPGAAAPVVEEPRLRAGVRRGEVGRRSGQHDPHHGPEQLRQLVVRVVGDRLAPHRSRHRDERGPGALAGGADVRARRHGPVRQLRRGLGLQVPLGLLAALHRDPGRRHRRQPPHGRRPRRG